jgi:TIR domain-containing protein/uncharacterized protein DUF4384
MPAQSASTGADVFISYSSRDRQRVCEILAQLQAAGIRLWWDQQRIDGAQVFTEEISSGIRACKALVLMGSQASMQSRWVNRELLLAEHHRKPILPLFLEPLELPVGFDLILIGIHYLEVTPETVEEKLPQICKALARVGVSCPGYGVNAGGVSPQPPALKPLESLGRLMALAAWTEFIRPVRPVVKRTTRGVTRDLGGLPPEPSNSFRLNEWVSLEIETDRPGHLLLLDVGPTGKVYCLCSSRFAPDTLLPQGKSYLPQDGSPWEAFYLSGSPGTERLLAILTDEPLDLDWIPTDPQVPARVLDQADIDMLLNRLHGLEEGRWMALATSFDVVP